MNAQKNSTLSQKSSRATANPPASSPTKPGPVISIGLDGSLQFIFDDALSGLMESGDAVISRASHVEPTGNGTQWHADMSPVGGPTLGPFERRCDALAAEVQYLLQNVI